MTTVYDAPPHALIERLKVELEKSETFAPPDWARFARTGVHTEKSPSQPDWWPRRVAAILRKVYLLGPVGTERLSAEFGGKRDAGSKPYHPRKGSRSVVRGALQQLEEAQYVRKTDNNRGRVVTPQGQRLLDNLAYRVVKDLSAQNPELTKYVGGKKGGG